MIRLLTHAAVIARRDFLATVATPTFLIFLLAPLFMIGLGVVSGTGAASMAANQIESTRIIALFGGGDAARIKAADADLRALYRADQPPPALVIKTPTPKPADQAQALFRDRDQETTAVMFGPLDRPHILYRQPSDRHARYLAALAETATRSTRAGLPAGQNATAAMLVPINNDKPTKTAQQASGFGAVFGIFFLTLLLAGQAVGMLAEEKSNKVIEILAAAVPLEAVFLGKLIGMFGAALVFVAFWGIILGGLVAFMPPSAGLASFHPAIGLPIFLTLCAAYFTMAYMLLGAVFLGVGAQASSMREIQMMSLPITIFQVAMFGLSSAAAGSPGSRTARIAEIFPFSSPFAMAARGASDATLWPHLLALAWQGLWVGLTILIAARLFRIGVLKSGGGWRGIFRAG
jgi:ABC-2 type transport system permease protein